MRRSVVFVMGVVMKIRAVTFVFAACVALSGSLDAHASSLLNIADGQCGGTGGDSQCSKSNAVVTATAMAITEIQPVTGNQGWTNFQAAFNSWNATLAVGSKWNLVVGTLAPETVLEFNVTLYRAYVQEGGSGPGSCSADPHCGGAEIQVSYTPHGEGAPTPITNSNSISAANAIRAQSISTNQKRDPSLPGNPYLDNAPGTPGADLGPPAYPFQYDGTGGSTASMLYDKPSRDDYAVWTADAWLSTVDYASKTLTVYDGLEWGFTVAAPLPATWTVMLTGLAGFGFVAYRRKRQVGLRAAA